MNDLTLTMFELRMMRSGNNVGLGSAFQLAEFDGHVTLFGKWQIMKFVIQSNLKSFRTCAI